MTLTELALASQEEKDAVQRLCDAVNLHVAALGSEVQGKYVAIRLEDGSSPDGALYDTRADAARHQSDPWCFYVKCSPAGIQPREAWVVLGYARQAYKAGVIFSEEEAIVPQRLELGGAWTERQRRSLALEGTFSRG
ncbi:hypothetical protein GTY62_15300 [Streptomyces sp. SID724]|uniref:hypothetical protein n=1 Tax=Streptomyces sp. SID724 TaxID=2690324 RepID=UPI001360FBD7|nr:hypothetical protein [Streptomyces sp. SID724]